MFVNAAGGGQQRNVRELSSAALLRIPPDGAKHSWMCSYDPASANGAGEIIFTLDGTESRLPLNRELRKAGGSFDRFGIFAARVPGRHLVAYFDDLVIDGQTETFTKDPHWEELGNRDRFRDPAPYGHNDFGYSPSHYAGGRSGELGGRLFSCNPGEEEFKAHYGDRVGTLTLDHRLSARGSKREKGEFLIFEPGKQYDWTLAYDPLAAEGRGMITFTLGGKSVTLPLRAGDKAVGALLNRFGSSICSGPTASGARCISTISATRSASRPTAGEFGRCMEAGRSLQCCPGHGGL